MSVPRLLIYLSAAAFAGFGAWLMLAPTALERVASVGLSEAEARAEIRAMYGGLELGIAAFLLWCAGSQARYEAGLALSALAFLGLAAGRLSGMAVEDAWTSAHWAALAAESVAFALSGLGLVLLARTRGSAR